jgi:DNA-binding response OmpR family regulator
MDCAAVVEGAGGVVAGITGNMSDALRDIETLDIDAALLDANLFGQSVNSLAAALTRRNVPFIFVSGYNKEALPTAFASTPMLCKPYSADQLIAAVQSICRRPRAVRELRKVSE